MSKKLTSVLNLINLCNCEPITTVNGLALRLSPTHKKKERKKDQRTFFDFENRLLITIYINNNIQQIPLQQYSITSIL